MILASCCGLWGCEEFLEYNCNSSDRQTISLRNWSIASRSVEALKASSTGLVETTGSTLCSKRRVARPKLAVLELLSCDAKWNTETALEITLLLSSSCLEELRALVGLVNAGELSLLSSTAATVLVRQSALPGLRACILRAISRFRNEQILGNGVSLAFCERERRYFTG